ncbi:MAG: carbamate kinase [Actinomycetota bacterium]
MRTAVVALGGNALTREDQAGTFQVQRANARKMARAIGHLLDADYRVVVTHGNGPQVGNLSLQQEQGATLAPPQPLFVLDAMTQGQIGHLLSLSLTNLIGDPRKVVALVTHVLVDPRDPAFGKPTKPIGPFFDREGAGQLASEWGWNVLEDAGRGFRRVVPSPEPREILEADSIRALVDGGFIVIAAGGGGVPVVRRRGRLEGVDAVIDKDLSAQCLASAVGAELLVLLTGVDRVALDFGTPGARPLATMTVPEAERYLEEGQFPPGSMGPKIQAALCFLRSGGEVAIITSADRAAEALAGTHGTRVVWPSEAAVQSAVGE